MKIKVINKSYDEVMSIPRRKHKKPIKPNMLFRTLLKLVSAPELKKVNFSCKKIDMERLGKKESALFLMNHTCFIDMEIVSTILYPRPFNIVTTTDAFVGKDLLLRLIGCIPTTKFATDTVLVRDILHAVRKLHSSIVLYPECGYSFDGRATVVPDTTAKLVKMLGIPLVMIRTEGAFAYDPLYNNLQTRKVNVTAVEKYLLSAEDIANMTVEEIDEIIQREFSFDNLRWQQENKIKIDEDWRADYLNRVLYKCPACKSEGKTVGRGTELYCESCGKRYLLDEYGSMRAALGECELDHIPDWYAWERECVREEILSGKYSIDVPVEIYMTVNDGKLYRVGDGRLTHGEGGFTLDGCEGKLHYEQKPLASYSICADFNFYEIGDVVAIGNTDRLYYCFPKCEGDIVAKIRLAAEELYKIKKAEKQRAAEEKKNADLAASK